MSARKTQQSPAILFLGLNKRASDDIRTSHTAAGPPSSSGSSPPLAPTRKRLNGPLKSHRNTARSRSENCFSGEVKKKQGRRPTDIRLLSYLLLEPVSLSESRGRRKLVKKKRLTTTIKQTLIRRLLRPPTNDFLQL